MDSVDESRFLTPRGATKKQTGPKAELSRAITVPKESTNVTKPWRRRFCLPDLAAAIPARRDPSPLLANLPDSPAHASTGRRAMQSHRESAIDRWPRNRDGRD